jgi:NAD(P)-dependent dehydrogenase (short-subunit alcohol dehydrogenase family)
MTTAQTTTSTVSQRIVLVTGSAFGIGWARAQCFAEFGDIVVIVDSNLEKAKARAASLGANDPSSVIP